MKLLEFLGIMLIRIMITIPLIMLNVRIITDIADVYNVTYIEQLTYSALFGTLLLLGFLRSLPNKADVKKAIKGEDKEDIDVTLTILITQAVIHCIVALMTWGIALLIHLLMF